jgi:tetratricopeptide (TPR) repeat protein
LKDAYFWRLLARRFEEDKHDPTSAGQACGAWEEFRRHAIHQGWLPAKGPEVASLYLRMAELLRRLDGDSVGELRYALGGRSQGFAVYYKDQPPEIRALAPVPSKDALYYLQPLEVLERACSADPRPENFEWWMREAEEVSEEAADRVAERWSEALPNDIPALLHLMQSAEKRNALQKAFKLMERAERIDGVNPEVRRARLRLLIAITVRHLR